MSLVDIEILHFGELEGFWDGEHVIRGNSSSSALMVYVCAGICVFSEKS